MLLVETGVSWDPLPICKIGSGAFAPAAIAEAASGSRKSHDHEPSCHDEFVFWEYR